jgi:processive 1,2-diacylglycerol beta-glucosyltransferase
MTVLIATGSFGMGPIEELIDALPGVQVAVICGHNKALYTRLQAKRSDLVHVFGLVQNMDEMMAVSDVMVTKPGGLSISEALVSALPMVFFSAIPGQETNNVNVLRHYNIGLSGLSITEIAVIIQEWNAHPQKLEDAKQRTRALAKPHAVDDIVAALDDGRGK